MGTEIKGRKKKMGGGGKREEKVIPPEEREGLQELLKTTYSTSYTCEIPLLKRGKEPKEDHELWEIPSKEKKGKIQPRRSAAQHAGRRTPLFQGQDRFLLKGKLVKKGGGKGLEETVCLGAAQLTAERGRR